jgi:prefoldin subunit 5
MAYKIEVDDVGRYIEYLKKFKKELEKSQADFDKDLKNAHQHWDDNNYVLTIEAKDKVAVEQKKLIEAINKSLKKLMQMHEEYEKYLRRR